uniref:Uncharacterized protein n=1 Tax=Manihot esculenta TaxID=3983 RepID=A0A2C9URQ7_MANES
MANKQCLPRTSVAALNFGSSLVLMLFFCAFNRTS